VPYIWSLLLALTPSGRRRALGDRFFDGPQSAERRALPPSAPNSAAALLTLSPSPLRFGTGGVWRSRSGQRTRWHVRGRGRIDGRRARSSPARARGRLREWRRPLAIALFHSNSRFTTTIDAVDDCLKCRMRCTSSAFLVCMTAIEGRCYRSTLYDASWETTAISRTRVVRT
jgi:hypothetical protein